jgi:H+/Cl- antiporter ClcA
VGIERATGLRRGLGAPVRGLASYLYTAPYLVKWIILGCLIGAIAGLGSVGFLHALKLGTWLFLHGLGGYQIPTVAKEGGLAGSAGFVRPWAIPLIVGLGALLSGLLVTILAPEAEGHGTDAAIDAVHQRPRGVRLRAVAVKIVASAITLGSGGSGGREGPTAQISSGFGSLLTRGLDLSHRDGRIAVAIGIGAGIGSIFSAPLGGAVLSAEILYRDDIEVEAIIPSFIASIVGYTIFGSFQGYQPMFGFVASGYNFHYPAQLGWYALIGIAAGLIGLLYSQSFYRLKALFERLPVPAVARPVMGGLSVGAIAVALPEVLGTGYGWIQQGFGPALQTLPLAVVLALPFAKILATSLSIGSGGSGGIFGPGMVIGAFTGAAVWRLLEPVAPEVPHTPAPFVIVGMMACFGSICRAPVAVMLMVAEMTGSITPLVPALIAVGLAYLIVHQAGDTIYRSQLTSRLDPSNRNREPAHPAAGSLRVTDFMQQPRVILRGQDGLGEALDALATHDVPDAPVTDRAGAFIGIVATDHLERATADSAGDTTIGRHLLDPAPPTMNPSDTLVTALDTLLESGRAWAPVLDGGLRIAGVLTISAVVGGYGPEPQTALHRAPLDADTALIEVVLATDSPLAGTAFGQASLPPRTIVITVERGPCSFAPRPGHILQPGDRLTVLAASTAVSAISELVAPPAPR